MSKPWFAPKYNKLTFLEVWPNVESFLLDCGNILEETMLLPTGPITRQGKFTLYWLLVARYGNNPIVNNDVTQWKMKIFAIMFAYMPAWEKKIQIQKTLSELTETDLLVGAKQIYNHALNPSTAPKTTDLDELNYINDQNVAIHKKAKMEAYSILWELIHTNHTEEFLTRFKDCFSKFVGIIPVPFYIDDIDVIPSEEEEEEEEE